MTTAALINLAIAVGTAVAASFAAATYFFVRRQARLTHPVVDVLWERPPGQPPLLRVQIAQPDKEKYEIRRVGIHRPRDVQIAKPRMEPDGLGGFTQASPDGDWQREVALSGGWRDVKFVVHGSPGTELTISITIALRSISKAKTRFTAYSSIPD